MTTGKKTPVVPSRVWYVLTPPPLVSQVKPMDCWAAGLASFQQATGINPAASREGLKDRYVVCRSYGNDGLPEQCVEPVFSGEGCPLTDIIPSDFDYTFVRTGLKKWGYLVAIKESGASDGDTIYHTLVVYGVGVAPDGKPDKTYFSVMNPNADSSTHSAGYQNLSFNNIKIVSTGHRAPPTPRHVDGPGHV
jgi:hypothetical protein